MLSIDVTETMIDGAGVQRHALNSNCQPIHWSEEGIRNLWRWFGDSKIVDEQGRPLVVYHGTGDVFGTFSKSELGTNTSAQSAQKGFFFSNSPRNANRYTVWSSDAIGEALGLRPPKGTSNRREWIENNNIWKKAQDEVDSVVAEFKRLIKKDNYANKEASAWFEINTPKLMEYGVDIPDSMVISYEELAKAAVVDANKMSGDDFKKGLSNYASNYTPDAEVLALKKQYDKAIGLLEHAQDLEYNRKYSKQFEESYDLDFDEAIDAKKPEPKANIMPVYLSMQNPFVHDYNGNYRDVSFSELLDKAKADGHDGAIFKNVNDPLMGDVYVAFEPTQITSVFNRGTFECGEW